MSLCSILRCRGQSLELSVVRCLVSDGAGPPRVLEEDVCNGEEGFELFEAPRDEESLYLEPHICSRRRGATKMWPYLGRPTSWGGLEGENKEKLCYLTFAMTGSDRLISQHMPYG